ncbi:PEP-CTERM sorting domain-containing protein [Opitutaceae bacterium TAV4]|nr:PEP-CTERM sorting domain-containing protein [Opitutaceae bacterium TAV4]RRK00234.1 PEP-CTERM sorting domain-containing protein [Opitutaceae bacterium TAV3]
MNIKSNKKFAAAFAAIAIVAATAQAATLLHEFTFNDPANGTSTASTGTLGGSASFTAPASAEDHSHVPTNLHSDNGLGVSGKLGDYTFNNTGSSQMGGGSTTPGYGGVATLSNGAASLNGLSSFTISGWYNTASATKAGNSARLVAAGTGFEILFQVAVTGANPTPAALRVTHGSSKGAMAMGASDTIFYQTNTWIFFAYTFDGGTGVGTIYGGDKTTGAVSALATGSVASTGGVVTASGNLFIGNQAGANQRPFDGLMDNVRVWGESSGAGGALSLAELQAVMTADLANTPIPEPATTAALLGAGFLMAVMIWRRRSV